MGFNRLAYPFARAMEAVNCLTRGYHGFMLRGYPKEQAIADVLYIDREVEAARRSLRYVLEKERSFRLNGDKLRRSLEEGDPELTGEAGKDVYKAAGVLNHTAEPLLNGFRQHAENARAVLERRRRDIRRAAKIYADERCAIITRIDYLEGGLKQLAEAGKNIEDRIRYKEEKR